MSAGVQVWDAFVASGVARSKDLAAGIQELVAEAESITSTATALRIGELAYHAFTIGQQAMLLGAEDVAHLALACERCLDVLAEASVPPDAAVPLLASATNTLAQAFDALANPDESGARTEGLPLEAARYELETLLPVPGQAPRPGSRGPDVAASALVRRPPASPGARAAPAAPGASPDATSAPAPSPGRWEPTVDSDMLELFFDEVNDRLEGLAEKLVEMERRPGDDALIRDLFRDLHTVKGSSAMVGLEPMNQLAHAAEDLVGQLRDKSRTPDGAVIDALLAALDALRDIAGKASRGDDLPSDLGPIVRRLRSPGEVGAAPVASEPGAAPGPASAPSSRAAPARQTIRVDFDKLDKLMNLVGELVLGRDGLDTAIGALTSVGRELSGDRQLSRQMSEAGRSVVADSMGARELIGEIQGELGRVERVVEDIAHELGDASGRLDSVSAQLRDSVMKLRMIPIGGIFRKHHRTVRDLAASLGKSVQLSLSGEDTELDKLLVEALDEPLMHLVRNAIDHGIESPAQRSACGKPEQGTVSLSAHHRGNQVVVEVRDDGKGIDPAFMRKRALERNLASPEEVADMDDEKVLDIIFRPGFSTADVVSEVSGRGVGMDVVRETIVNRLKGTIDIESHVGAGSVFTLRLPLTLAIIQVLLARAGGEVFAIPLDSVVRTLTVAPSEISVVGNREMIAVRGRQVPLIRLATVLEIGQRLRSSADPVHVVLSEIGSELVGLVCENLLGKKEIVIKSLGDILENVPCTAGATLLGDRCALILDVPAIVARAATGGARRPPPPPVAATGTGTELPDDDTPHVLLVEDSDTVRESLRRLLVNAGFKCTVARDGAEGFEIATAGSFDLISTDVMMPRMDGYELTRALRATDQYRDIPIIMVTSRGERIDRVRGFDAGVDEYITKPHDRHELLRAVRRLVQRAPTEGGEA